MKRLYLPAVIVAMAMFVAAPFRLMSAPDIEVANATSGVLLSYKIFYYHVPSAMVMFLAAFTSGIASGMVKPTMPTRT